MPEKKAKPVKAWGIKMRKGLVKAAWSIRDNALRQQQPRDGEKVVRVEIREI
jgi:hypothetical protein